MATPQHPVSLREITADTVIAIVKLSVAESQQRFVAPNAVSLAQALFAPEAWCRAIYFGEEPVGFVMLHDESLRTAPPAMPELSVWRFMVAEQHQGKGIGRAALQLVIEHARSKGLFRKLALSYVPAEGSAEAFYLSLGFRNTDRFDGSERVMELSLDQVEPDACLLGRSMTMSASDFAQWLARYGHAWETGDPDGVLELFARHAEYYETPFDPPMVGHEAIHRYWTDGAMNAQRKVRFQAQPIAFADRTGHAHWTASFERVASGARVEIDGVLSATFDEGMRCEVFREWWHRRET